MVAMNTSKTSSIVLIVLGSLLLVALVIWLSILIEASKSPIEILAGLVSTVLPAAALFYSQLQKRSIRFFLFANRISGLLNDHVLTWRLSAKLTGDHIQPSSIDKIIQDITEELSHQFTIDTKRINKFSTLIFIDPGPTLEISYVFPEADDTENYGLEDSRASLKILIRNYRIGYRQASHIIRKEVVPILEGISRSVKPAEQKFTFDIDFDRKRNPFWGLYITSIPAEIVSSFFVRLQVNAYSKNETVLISESKLTINTESETALQNLALEFLAFDSGLRERLTHG
jgi:hypothetical protein